MPWLEPETTSLERGHEPLQTRVDWVVGLGVTLTFAIIVFLGLLVGLTRWFGAEARQAEAPPSPLLSQRDLPPPPRLQVAPPRDLQTYRQQQQQLLESYGWVDRQGGIVRVPIEQALRRAAAGEPSP